jgi:hypothetical protein
VRSRMGTAKCAMSSDSRSRCSSRLFRRFRCHLRLNGGDKQSAGELALDGEIDGGWFLRQAHFLRERESRQAEKSEGR